MSTIQYTLNSSEEQIFQELVFGIILKEKITCPIKSISIKSGMIKSFEDNLKVNVILKLDYFQRSLFTYLVIYNQKETFLDWINILFRFLNTYEISELQRNKFDNILLNSFVLLFEKNWPQLLENYIYPIWEFGTTNLNWDVKTLEKCFVDGKNALQRAYIEQNLKLVIWLIDKVRFLMIGDEYLWFESGIIKNGETSLYFLEFLKEKDQSKIQLEGIISKIPNPKILELLKIKIKSLYPS